MYWEYPLRHNYVTWSKNITPYIAYDWLTKVHGSNHFLMWEDNSHNVQVCLWHQVPSLVVPSLLFSMFNYLANPGTSKAHKYKLYSSVLLCPQSLLIWSLMYNLQNLCPSWLMSWQLESVTYYLIEDKIIDLIFEYLNFNSMLLPYLYNTSSMRWLYIAIVWNGFHGIVQH